MIDAVSAVHWVSGELGVLKNPSFQAKKVVLSFDANKTCTLAAWPCFSLYEPFAPALGWEVNNAVSRVYAVEGSCFVLAPSCVISQEAVDELCDTADKKNLIHAGGGHSVIYGPDGSSLTPKIP
ncbi:hypothetical protein [Herbaspirillum sp. C9C3]|uniref:hypothetical protein n=1 Tax=Herbaspirillum sp. C9C3 TaxID=2735271 RepID=UPI001C2F104B|nr:hypothetical protein [Herbaspirillum sp. C9C3]